MTRESDHTYDQDSASKLREAVRAAAQHQTSACVNLAQLLFNVRFGTTASGVALAVAWGFDSFDTYAETEVGMHAHTAQAYVQIYDELFIRRGLALDELPASITKLRLLSKISRHVKDARELSKWITRAKARSTCCDLEAEAEEQYGITGSRHKTVSFSLQWSRVAPLMRAIRAARTSYGVESNAEALSAIVDEWMKENRKPSRKAAG